MRDLRHISAVYGGPHLHLCSRHKANTWKSRLKAVMTTMSVTSSDHSLIAWVFELIYCLYETKATESLMQQYSRITSTKSPSYCVITSSTSLTCRIVLLPPVTWMQLLRKQTNSGTTATALIPETHRYTRTLLRALSSTCNTNLNWLMLPAPEAGGSSELTL